MASQTGRQNEAGYILRLLSRRAVFSHSVIQVLSSLFLVVTLEVHFLRSYSSSKLEWLGFAQVIPCLQTCFFIFKMQILADPNSVGLLRRLNEITYGNIVLYSEPSMHWLLFAIVVFSSCYCWIGGMDAGSFLISQVVVTLGPHQ